MALSASDGGIYRVLTMDGGGVHGLLTGLILRRIQDARPDFLQRVTVLAGTSAGGITALLLASGGDPADHIADCISLWETPELFSNTPAASAAAMVGLRALYANDTVSRELRRRLSATTTLADLTRCVVVPTVELDNHGGDALSAAVGGEAGFGPRSWRTRVFHNFLTTADVWVEGHLGVAEWFDLPLEARPYPPGEALRDLGETAFDVAMRASAGPIGMPVYQGYLDGGLFASNPCMAALALVLDEYRYNAQRPAGSVLDVPDFNRSVGDALDSVYVLSLGTGHNRSHEPAFHASYGVAQWLLDGRHPFALLDVVADCIEEAASYQCLSLLGMAHYRRFNPQLPGTVPRVTNITTGRARDMLRSVALRADIAPLLEWLDGCGWTTPP